MCGWLALLLASALIAGCSPLDVASHHSGPPPVCEVHHITMEVEIIQLTTGEIGYVWGTYREPLENKFPHHGDWVYDGERAYGFGPRKVRDFVCPECTVAFHGYWKPGS